MKAHICHFSTVHLPSDNRVFFKECSSLARNGWKVTLVIQDDTDRRENDVDIVALKQTKSRLYRILILSWICFFKCVKVKAKIYHFHDPELMGVGVMLRCIGKKVVYDVHEDYSKQILDKTWLGPRFFRRLLSWITKVWEKFASLFFQGVVAATVDIAENFNPKKTVVVYNYSSLEFMDAIQPAKVSDTDTVKVMYAGGLTRIRGIQELIEAVGQCNNAELWLFGKWESEEFKSECSKLLGWQKTTDFGFQLPNTVFSYLKHAHIGIHLIHPLPRYLVGIPTKVFEYMTYGKPVLITNSEFWHEIFGEAVVFSKYNETDIQENMKRLVESKELREELGKNGRQLVEEKYCWENEYPKMEKLYNRILGNN